MPQRIVRWVEGSLDSPVVFWDRVFRVSGIIGDRVIKDVTSDTRTTDYPGYTDDQLADVKKARVRLLQLIMKLRNCHVAKFHYDAEAGIIWWDESFSIGGKLVTDRQESQDLTLLEAGQALVESIAVLTNTPEKPVWPHEFKQPPEGSYVRTDL